MGKSNEPEKKIDVERTINSIFSHTMRFATVDQEKLKVEAENDPNFLIKVAEMLRVEIFYL